MHINHFFVGRKYLSVNQKCNNTSALREQSQAKPDQSACRRPWGWRAHRLWSPPLHNRQDLFSPESPVVTGLLAKCIPHMQCSAGDLWVYECQGLTEQLRTTSLSSGRRDGRWWRPFWVLSPPPVSLRRGCMSPTLTGCECYQRLEPWTTDPPVEQSWPRQNFV